MENYSSSSRNQFDAANVAVPRLIIEFDLTWAGHPWHNTCASERQKPKDETRAEDPSLSLSCHVSLAHGFTKLWSGRPTVPVRPYLIQELSKNHVQGLATQLVINRMDFSSHSQLDEDKSLFGKHFSKIMRPKIAANRFVFLWLPAQT